MGRNLVVSLLVAVSLAAPFTEAQTLYVMDGFAVAATQQESMPAAGPCAAPNPLAYLPWSYGVVPCPFGPGATVSPPAGILGDLATDRLTDTVFITDGFVFGEYIGDPACGPGGAPLAAWPVPPIVTLAGTIMGPITGAGFDSIAGILWVTDGADIAGLGPLPSVPGTCAPPGIVVPAFPHGIPGATPLTDVTWDPFSVTLWACDALGGIHNILVGGGPAGPSFAAAFCGLGAPLQGIAYDLATPGVSGTPPSLYVTDGFAIAYLDVTAAALSAGSFYTPVACGGSLMPTNGLAYAAGGITYGTPRFAMTVDSFGQSSSPGPTWGFQITGAPPATVIWIVANFIPPGPGFSCPPIASAGTILWVDPFPPAIIMPLFGAPPGCTPMPTPLPPFIPAGINIFVQYVAIGSSGFAIDATSGLEFTITSP